MNSENAERVHPHPSIEWRRKMKKKKSYNRSVNDIFVRGNQRHRDTDTQAWAYFPCCTALKRKPNKKKIPIRSLATTHTGKKKWTKPPTPPPPTHTHTHTRTSGLMGSGNIQWNFGAQQFQILVREPANEDGMGDTDNHAHDAKEPSGVSQPSLSLTLHRCRDAPLH
jgi:hypothetical protein